MEEEKKEVSKNRNLVIAAVVAVAAVVLVVIVVVVALATRGGVSLEETYETENYTIGYPANWEKQDYLGMVSFMPEEVEEEDAVIFMILSTPMAEEQKGKSFDELSQEVATNLETSLVEGDSEVLSTNRTSLAGMEAERKEFKISQDGEEGKMFMIWAVGEENMYVLLYTGADSNYGNYVSTAEAMVNSFAAK